MMRPRQTAFKLSMTSESLQEARREVTKYAEFIIKAWGCEDFLFIHEQIDSLEEALLSGEGESEECKARIEYIASVIDFCPKAHWVLKGPLYRVDLFPEYEKKIRKKSSQKGKSEGFSHVPFSSLEAPYRAVEKSLLLLEKKNKGLECGMLLIKDNPKNFYDPETEEGITFVVRMKVKKPQSET